MKQSFNNLEDLLKGTLEGYSKPPSRGVWGRVSRQIPGSGKILYLLIPIFILISSGGVYYWSEISQENNNTPNIELSSHIYSTDENIQPSESAEEILTNNNNSTTESSLLVSNPNSKQSNNEELTSTSNSTLITNTTSETKTYIANTKTSTQSNQVIQTTNVIESKPVVSSETKDYYSEYPDLERFTISGIGAININSENLVKQNNYSKNQYMGLRNLYSGQSVYPIHDYGLEANLSLGILISAEKIYHNDDLNSKSEAYNIDLNVYLGKNDWFLQGGLGINQSSDNGIFDIQYEQYDSIGYYYKISSFVINEQTGQPEFTQETEGLFDTVQYQQTETTSNRYTYFRLPIYAGINVYKQKRISVSIKAGAVYSYLLNKKEPGINFSNDQATSVEISDNTAIRRQSTVQLSAALGINYQLSNRLDLSLEPSYNYYMQTIYRRSYTDKLPYSVGLKFGFIYNF